MSGWPHTCSEDDPCVSCQEWGARLGRLQRSLNMANALVDGLTTQRDVRDVKAIADARAQGVREAIAAAERVPIAIHASRDEAELVADAISRTRGFVIRAIKALLPPDPIQGERCEHGAPPGHCIWTACPKYHSKPAPPGPFCHYCGSLLSICGGCP